MAYTAIKSWLDEELEGIREAGLYKNEKIIRTPQGPQVETDDGQTINFCANNYLGLAHHPAVIEAVEEGMASHGFGMASVRFICGTQDIHKALESRISEFLGAQDTILYTSCFDANTGLFETLLGAEDAIISDALNHASIIDGVRLCRAQKKIFGHSDMAGPGGEAEGVGFGALSPHRHGRRFQHARGRGPAGGDMRPCGPVRCDRDGRRLSRDRLHGTERPRDAGAVGCARPRRRHNEHTRKGARRRLGRLHVRPKGDGGLPAAAL